MAYKRGQTETPSFTLGLIISLLILLALGIIGYQIAQKNIDVRARVAFTDFLHYYGNCTSYGTTDCYCETLDLSLMPSEYGIRVVDLESDQLGFELMKGSDVRQTSRVTGRPLCAYSTRLNTFYSEPIPSYAFSHRKGEFLKTALFLLDNMTCFAISPTPLPIAVTVVLESLHREKTSCAASPQSFLPLIFVYHEASNSDPRMLSLLDTLDQHLISFSRISVYHNYGSSQYEINQRLLRAAPDQNFTAMTILSFDHSRSDFPYSLGKTTSDHIIIRYLSNSPRSLLLAQTFSDALRSLVPVTLTPLDEDDAPSHMFWADDDSLLYDHRQSLPALSLEFVDDGEEPYFSDYKDRTLAQIMSTAVLTSLSTSPASETESLF